MLAAARIEQLEGRCPADSTVGQVADADNSRRWVGLCRVDSEAMLTLAAITLMTRRLTRQPIHPNAAAPRPQAALRAA